MTILSSGTSPRVHWSGVKVTRTVDLGAPAISPPVFQSVTRKVTELARLSLHTNYNGPDTKRLRYWLHGPGFQTRQVQDFSLIQRSALKSTGLLFNGCRSSYPGVKWPGWREGEVNNSPPSSAEVKNEWSNTPLPLYAFMAWTWKTSLLQLHLTHPNSN